ncbi:MAG: hypothetical protein NT040_03415 [Bacteroidetes bacterium]|nr:hypothetical protein [Bacteroidota bacterium]
MKTTKIFSVLSLALILTAVTSVFSAPIDNKNNLVSATPVIHYRVNITLSVDKPLCNLWLVKILDENGRMVAPAKPYTNGITKYDFYERGPASGTRIAVLVKNQHGDPYVCATELFTTPVAIFGKFFNGETYRFDLYPTTQNPKQ